MIVFGVFILLIFLVGLVSERLEKTVITAPLVFTAAGMLLFLGQPGLVEREVDSEVWLTLAEVALVLILFSDATRINLRALTSDESLPLRLLGIGMPLTILLGLGAAVLVAPGLSFWEAGILAAILAPTDAGLGEIVVSSPQVPVRIRQALNVESGLNDGLSVPFLMLFIALAQAEATGAFRILLSFAWQQVGYGLLVGLAIGLGGGWLMGLAVGPVLGEFNLAVAGYALLSLTVIRMGPVALSLLGTRLSRSSVLFMGWFGPRGLPRWC